MDITNLSRRRFGAAALGAGASAAAIAATATPASAQTPPSPWWFNVKDYGATGNGTTDDTTAIQHTINVARLYGGGVVILPAGTYKVTAGLQLTDEAGQPATYPTVSLQGAGPHATRILVAPGNYQQSAAIQAFGRNGTKYDVTSGPLTKRARSIVMPQELANELNPGDIVGIEATGPKVFGQPRVGNPREIHRVTQKTQNTTIWLDSPLVFDYTTVIQAWKMTAPHGITIRDLSFVRTADNVRVYAIRLQRAADVAVERVTLSNASGGIYLYDVLDGHVRDVTVDRLPNIPDPTGHYGYGLIAAGASANLAITGLVGRWCRHVFTTLADQRDGTNWGGPRDIAVVGGIAEGGPGSKALWDTHDFGTNIQFIGCSARGASDGVGQIDTGTYPGFQVRAEDVSIIDCVATQCGGNGIQTQKSARNLNVHGGVFSHNQESGIAGAATTMRIVDAHIHHNGKQGIAYHAVQGWEIIHIQGCQVEDNGLTGSGWAIHHSDAAAVASVVVSGNVIPKSATQGMSLLGLKSTTSKKVVIAHNIFLGYGIGSMGDSQTQNAITSFNTVDTP